MQNPLNSRMASAWLAGLALSCGSSVELAGAPPPPQFRADPDPTSLGQINERVGDLVVDEQRIYWVGIADSHNGEFALRSCAKENCAETVVSYVSTEYAQPLGVAAGQVFWLSPEESPSRMLVLSCPIEGCSGSPRTVASTKAYPSASTFTADAAYLCGKQLLRKVPLNAAGPQVDLASPATCASVAVHGAFVYWIGQADADSSFALQRTSSDGSGSPELLADNVRLVSGEYQYFLRQPQRLAFGAGYVYWSEGTLYGSILRCPLSGCLTAPEVVAEPVRSPTSLLLDGGTLYWGHDTSSSGLAISSLQLPHGAPSAPLASGVVIDSALATDERYVYTATTDSGLAPDRAWLNAWASIRRIPKASESTP